ncbi:MAG: polyprenyl synthetase family protein [Planctomycetota bacterium]|nr:MAG: polyprenyl synthetase family protein [Planctomycetota bacterium]
MRFVLRGGEGNMGRTTTGRGPFVETALAVDAALEPELAAVEALVGARLAEREGPLAQACATLVQRGGKRLRPLVALLAARAAGGAGSPAAVRVAAAAELVHTATLVHDDLVDRAPLRRGGSSVHVSHGRAAALLTGDFLVALAFGELARLAEAAPIVARLSDTIVQLAEGECAETSVRWQLALSLERREAIGRAKIAALLAWAAGAAAQAVGADADVCAALVRYGQRLGEAFGHADDLLDWVGDVRWTGKPVWSDIRHGRVTAPLILGFERDPALEPLVDRLRTEPLEAEAVGRRIEEIHDRLEACGAFAATRERIRLRSEQAVEALEVLPPSASREALAAVAWTVCRVQPDGVGVGNHAPVRVRV